MKKTTVTGLWPIPRAIDGEKVKIGRKFIFPNTPFPGFTLVFKVGKILEVVNWAWAQGNLTLILPENLMWAEEREKACKKKTTISNIIDIVCVKNRRLIVPSFLPDGCGIKVESAISLGEATHWVNVGNDLRVGLEPTSVSVAWKKQKRIIWRKK